MFCNKCGKEIKSSIVFCEFCGEKIEVNQVHSEISLNKKSKINIFNVVGNLIKKHKFIIAISTIITGVIVVASVVLFIIFNDPVSKYINLIEKQKYSNAASIYKKEITGNLDNETKMKSEANKLINLIKDDFLNNRIDYDNATKRLYSLSNIDITKRECSSAKDIVEKYNTSKLAYSKAIEFERNNDIENAMQQYKLVIDIDENYNKAQNNVLNLKPKYKEQIINSVDKLISEQKYNEAISKISTALLVIKNDSDLLAKKTVCETKQMEMEQLEKAAKIENLKNNQKVTVQSARAYDDGYSFVFRKASVVVRNNSNQVVKDYIVGILMFDDSGYPVEVSYSFQGDKNLFKGSSQSANIQPGGIYGGDYYWKIEDNATKVKACIISAEFYDGTTWNNEFYEYWLENNKSRY